MSKLVSIITPCYNGEKYLDKFFKSIISQTYPAVELIFVNDGSSDRTEEMALHYGEQLKARGYKFKYIYQENAGQSAAINQGLKVFKGDYLNWTDSDDYLTNDSIEKRVRFLEDNPEVGLVIGGTSLVKDTNYEHIGILDALHSNRTTTKDIIEDYLKGVFVNPCCSAMVRTWMFKEAMNNTMRIEEVREIGQNYQLFIPIIFTYPVRYIQEILSYCVIHNDSHSHSKKSFEQKIHILDVGNDTLNRISDRIQVNDIERKWFKGKIAEYDCKNRLEALQHYHRKDGLAEIVRKLKQVGAYDSSARKMVLKIKYPFMKNLSDRLWRLKNK